MLATAHQLMADLVCRHSPEDERRFRALHIREPDDPDRRTRGPDPRPKPRHFTLIFNFLDELRRIAPLKK
jgi:hypothetical protein